MPACVCAACVLVPVQELATGTRGMAGTAALPPRQGGAGRTDGSRRKSERREEAATKVEVEGQTGRGGNQREGRYSLAAFLGHGGDPARLAFLGHGSERVSGPERFSGP